MKEKIKKVLSSKPLAIILLLIDVFLAFSYGITGAITPGQHIMALLGNAVALFILFTICQLFKDKNNTYYNLTLAIIIYWLFYFFVFPVARGLIG